MPRKRITNTASRSFSCYDVDEDWDYWADAVYHVDRTYDELPPPLQENKDFLMEAVSWAVFFEAVAHSLEARYRSYKVHL
jgi:hypothetical protein